MKHGLFVMVFTLLLVFMMGCSSDKVGVEEKPVVLTESDFDVISRDRLSQESHVGVLAAENRVDPEVVYVNKGDVLELEIVSTKDSYMSLRGKDDIRLREDGVYVYEFKAEEQGVYELGCAFDCEQADLAREITIIVE